MAEDNSSFKAPSYNKLINQVSVLAEQVRLLQTGTPGPSAIGETHIPAVDYRIPELDLTVLTFTGHELNHVAEDWIETVDGLAHLNDWPLRVRLHFVRTNTRDAARNWFRSENFDSWDDLMFKFRKVFVRKIRQSDRWESLYKCTHAQGEHIVDYFYDKVRLCKELSLSFPETRDFVIQGIRSSDLTQYVLNRSHTSATALLADLRDWERMITLRRKRFFNESKSTSYQRPYNRSRNVKPTAVETKGTEPHTTKTTISSTPSNTFSSPTIASTRTSSEYRTNTKTKCYNCNGFGHISRDCPKLRRPFKCSICGFDQHSRGRCPNVKDEQTPALSQDSALRADTDYVATKKNSFSKTVFLNELQTTGLIDSGSSNVLVRATIA